MNINRWALFIIIISGLLLSGCGLGQHLRPTMTQVLTATLTQTPTSTSTAVPIPTETLTPTTTSTPTQTPSPISISYNPVPRWMILGQPFYDVEIMGENWIYKNDRWGESYGCIDYTRERGPYVLLEQCFALIQDTLNFESVLAPFLEDDFEVLIPSNTFDDAGQISILGKKIEENSEIYVKFFELVGTEEYILLVEMNIETDETVPLQTVYEDQAADIINYVLQNSLEKSRILPRPTATPLSPKQESYYAAFAAKLITETEASILYSGTWEALGDRVFSDQKKVVRLFEDRTNADVRWVRFINSVSLESDIPFESIADYYQQPGDTLLKSRHEFENKFVLYGYNDGHTYFDAYLLDDEFIYFVQLESRTLVGESVEDVFTEDIDDFIYDVLMTNLKK